MITREMKYDEILSGIPSRIADTDILLLLQGKEVNWEYVQTLKEKTHFRDETLSSWLNVSVKTFRSYKKPQQEINDTIREHVLLLLSLMQHGETVFGSVQKFEEWLNKENFYFNSLSPATYLKTVTGIRFIDDRLTAMEYGDNV